MVTCSNAPAPVTEDGATIFFTALPEGLDYGLYLKNTIRVMQAHGHELYLFDKLGKISTSNNVFENERQERTNIKSYLEKVPSIVE
jgi:hypothetical protein